MSEDATAQEQQKPVEEMSSFQPPVEPNGQMGQQYTKDELNVILNLIHGCTIKGADAPVINALGIKTATMIQEIG